MEFLIENGELKKAWGYDESIVIPKGVQRLCEGVFTSFAYMEEIILPEGLKSIDEHAFNNCLELKSIVIPDSVETIGEYAFQYCKKMTAIKLPSSLGRVESCCFRYCEALKSASLPQSVSFVGYDAFFGCSALEEVSAQNPSCEFGRRVFYGCNALYHLDAPYAALMRLDEDRLARVCAEFCRLPKAFSETAREAYREILSRPSQPFMSLICGGDDNRALGFLLDMNILKEKETEEFLRAARDFRANKCAGALMEYKNRFFRGKKDDILSELEI